MKTSWKTLNYRQIRRGMELCNDNVVRLMRNAAIALKDHQWAATVYQAVLAMEEQGRLLLLYEAYIDGVIIDKEMWRIMFGDHRKKITAAAAAFFIQRDKRKWRRTLDKMGAEFQELKERALYVNFDSRTNRWIHPGRIDSKKAMQVFKKAAEFVKDTRQLMSDE